MSRDERRFAKFVLCLMVVLPIGAALSSSAEAANSRLSDKEAIITYARADACVDEGKATQVTFPVRNTSGKDKIVVIRPWGLKTGNGFESQKGAWIDADIAASRLTNTLQDPSWRWVIKLKPGESAEPTLFIKSVPVMWDYSWGYLPPGVMRFSVGAAVNVKYSSEIHFPDAYIPYRPYCK